MSNRHQIFERALQPFMFPNFTEAQWLEFDVWRNERKAEREKEANESRAMALQIQANGRATPEGWAS